MRANLGCNSPINIAKALGVKYCLPGTHILIHHSKEEVSFPLFNHIQMTRGVFGFRKNPENQWLLLLYIKGPDNYLMFSISNA